MLRGNGGRLIFSDDEDRTRFCLMLQKAAEEYLIVIHAFCFMNNHVHLILEPTTTPLSKGVQSVAGRYAQYFNRRYKHRGHLFQDRFRSILIEDGDYLRRLVRYIHLNPVRANLVVTPQSYRWSSYCAYLGIENITWLTQIRVLKNFSTTEIEARQALVMYMAKKLDAELDIGIIHESNQIGAFGNEEFIKEVVHMPTTTAPIKISFINLVATALAEFQIKLTELASESREKRLVDLRSVLALAVQKVPGLYLQDLAHHLNRDASSLCRLVKRASQSQDLSLQAEKLLKTASTFNREQS